MQILPFIQNDPLLQDNQVQPVLVLGLGNILMQDEGIGVRAVQQLLRDYEFPPEVEVLDGGTAGMALYEHIVNRSHVIVIDAVKTGREPGALVKLENDEVPAFFRNKVSPHQMALSDILAALKIGGEQLPEIVVIGVEPATLETGLDMSDLVLAQLDALVEKAVECLGGLGFAPQAVTRH
jgi:hydrogenase maturation protease